MVGIDFHNCYVRSGIDTDDLSLEFPVIGQRNFHVGGTIYNVTVRYDVTVRVDDNARSEAAFPPFSRYAKLAQEILAEEFLKDVLIHPTVLAPLRGLHD